MADKEKKRLALTANKIPDKHYKKLEELGADRKLTPYIVELMEKEQMMNKLIVELPALSQNVKTLEQIVLNISAKLDKAAITVVHSEIATEQKEEEIQEEEDTEAVPQGDLGVTGVSRSEFDEKLEDMDYDF